MSQSPIDAPTFEALVALEADAAPGLVQGMIQKFFEDAPSSIEKIKQAIEKNDAHAVSLEVHNLKSSCAYLGAFPMRNICLELEHEVHPSANFSKVSSLTKQLEEEYQCVKSNLEMRRAAL